MFVQPCIIKYVPQALETISSTLGGLCCGLQILHVCMLQTIHVCMLGFVYG